MILSIKSQTNASIRRICDVIKIPRSSFYFAANPSSSQLADQTMSSAIERIFRQHKRRYGYRRIVKQLADEGTICAPARVRRLMQQRGLVALQPKNYVPKTSDGRADCPSPNLLLDRPLPACPNQVWAGDITFIRAKDRWLYLAVVIDLNSRAIVGWALAEHMRSELVCQALNNALKTRSIDTTLIFHSDRGSQYGSRAYRSILDSNGIKQSMSARANPYHNAWTESFMGTLKNEMLQDGYFQSFADAYTEISDFIDVYYNRFRKHSSLGYLSPEQFELQNASKN